MIRSWLRWAIALSWRGKRWSLLGPLALTLLTASLGFVMAGTISLHQSTARAESRVAARTVHPIGSIRDGQFDAFQSTLAGDAIAPDPDIVFDTWIWSTPDGRSLQFVILEALEAPSTSGGASFAGIEAGQPGWYVSEGFRTVMDDHPGYTDVLSEARLLDREVLRSPDEVLAIQVLPDGVPLVQGVAGVVDPGGNTTLGSVEQTDPAIETMAIVLVLVLCSVVLVAALHLGMSVQRARERIFAQIGASRAQIQILRVVTAIAVTLPGLVGGVALWQLTADRFTSRPVDAQAVFSGDLSLSGTSLVVAGVLMVVAIAAASLLRSDTRVAESSNHHDGSPQLTRLYWFAPPSLTAFIAVWLDASPRRDLLLGATLVFFIAALWRNLPLVLATVGGSLAALGRDRAPFLLAGRRLQHDAASTGRAVGFLAVLALLAPLISVWFDAGAIDEPTKDLPFAAYDFGPVGLPGDYELFASIAELSIAPVPIVFIPSTRTGADGSVPQPIMLAPGDCSDWVDAGGSARCVNGTTLEGPTLRPINFVGNELSLADARAQATDYLVRYDRPEQRQLIHQEATLLNIARVSQRSSGDIDGNALFGPNFAVVRSYQDPVYRRNVAWIAATTVAIVTTGVVVSLLFVALRARRTGADRSRLGAIGATWRRIRGVAFIETFAAMVTVSVFGLVAAAVVVFCLRFVHADIPQPNTSLLTWEAMILLALSIGAALTAAAAVRDPASLWNEQNSSLQ